MTARLLCDKWKTASVTRPLPIPATDMHTSVDDGVDLRSSFRLSRGARKKSCENAKRMGSAGP